MKQIILRLIIGILVLTALVGYCFSIQLPKAGHLLLMEDAEEAVAEYISFLQTISSP